MTTPIVIRIGFLTAFLVWFGGFSAVAFAQNGTLRVTSYPTGADVIIDGVDTGKRTPMSVSLNLGDHLVTVAVAGAGWNPDTRNVTIAAGTNDLSVTLLPMLTGGPPGPPGQRGPAGEQGPIGPQGPAGPAGDGELLVVDSLNQKVGVYFPGGQILMNDSEEWFSPGFVSRAGFVNQLGEFWYQLADCSDSPYIQASATSLNVNGWTAAQQSWIPDRTLPSVVLTPPSGGFTVYIRGLLANGSMSPCAPRPLFSSVTLFPARSIDLSRFVTPFRLQ